MQQQAHDRKYYARCFEPVSKEDSDLFDIISTGLLDDVDVDVYVVNWMFPNHREFLPNKYKVGFLRTNFREVRSAIISSRKEVRNVREYATALDNKLRVLPPVRAQTPIV